MSFANRISQTLHDEHGATAALMGRLKQFLAHNRRGGPPGSAAGNVARLLSDLSVGLGTEVERHFAFEENHLFAYLEVMGDGGIGADLTSEHTAIRPLGARVAEIARVAAAKSFTLAEWEEFVRLGQELADCLLAHVQKEEMALLPVIEETMDAETEARLYQEYVDNA
jgi:iron-sulfur cluster repair protein YtfE (RIC family)